jgi:hypothetical protein
MSLAIFEEKTTLETTSKAYSVGSGGLKSQAHGFIKAGNKIGFSKGYRGRNSQSLFPLFSSVQKIRS